MSANEDNEGIETGVVANSPLGRTFTVTAAARTLETKMSI